MAKTEAQTRAERIDSQLAQSGWNVKDPTQVIEEFDILMPLPEGVAEPRTPYEGHQFSDYVLIGRDRNPLAVVETKKSSKDAAIDREQAKQYCYNIQKQLGGELPFCFYTNGHEIYFWDLENYPPCKVVGFPIDERYKAKCCDSDAKDWLEQICILRDIYDIAPEASLATVQQQTAKTPVANSNFLKLAFLEGCQRAGLFDAIAQGGDAP